MRVEPSSRPRAVLSICNVFDILSSPSQTRIQKRRGGNHFVSAAPYGFAMCCYFLWICRCRSRLLLDQAHVHGALRHLHHGDKPEEVLEMLAHGLTNKLLHDPTILLRNGEGLSNDDRDLVGRMLDRFYRRHDR